jgi:hypothetical protein
VDGRFIVRGEDAIYCYDLRQDAKPSANPATHTVPATVETRQVEDQWQALAVAQAADPASLPDLLTKKDVALAMAAARVLATAPATPERLKALASAATGMADRRVKIAALTALEKLGVASAPVVPQLLQALPKGSKADQVLIERTLATVIATGKAGEAAILVLNVLDKSAKDGLDRRMAIRMLTRIGPASLPALKKGMGVETLKWPVIVAFTRLLPDAGAKAALLDAVPYVQERGAQKRRDDTEYWSLLETLPVLATMKDDPKVKAALEAVAAGPQDYAGVAARLLERKVQATSRPAEVDEEP